jgi:hypothetical protein
MLKEAHTLVLRHPLKASTGDTLVILPDGMVGVLRPESWKGLAEAPDPYQEPLPPLWGLKKSSTPPSEAVAAPAEPVKAAVSALVESVTPAKLGGLAPENRDVRARRRNKNIFTVAEREAFKELAYSALAELKEATAPQVANYLGYFAESKNRLSHNHLTYEAVAWSVVELYREGKATRRAIGGGPLRVIYAYAIKQEAAA